MLQAGAKCARMTPKQPRGTLDELKERTELSKRVAILGSTGSIGRQAVELLDGPPALRCCGLGAGNNWELLCEQVRQCHPEAVAIANVESARKLAPQLPDGVELLSGSDAMCELVRRTRPDIVLIAVVGAGGLGPTLAAIETGATLALANKEALVCAGQIVMPAARAAAVDVLPVDSEHSGIFQCMQTGRRKDVRRVILTSSGGSLRDMDDRAAAEATMEQVLNHPVWRMGPKITVDSATLMNKALEVIEAHWLFDLSPDQIEVVIHPQSIVHAMVEFCDGSIIAQLANPDMKGPIAYALHYPNRPQRETAWLDFSTISKLEFRPVIGRFARALELAYEVIRRGGASGAVLNAANEAAVEAFLAGKIPFGLIVPIVEQVLEDWGDSQDFSRDASDSADKTVTLNTLLGADAWARQQVAAVAPHRCEKSPVLGPANQQMN